MATGEGCVTSVMQGVIHPFKPPIRVAADLPPGARKPADSGWLSPSNLHGDTLLRVSPIILNENTVPSLHVALEAQLNRLDVLMGAQAGTYAEDLSKPGTIP